MEIIRDFSEHNAEVRRVWDAFNAEHPIRVPVVFDFSMRFSLLTPELNPRAYLFKDYIIEVEKKVSTSPGLLLGC